MSYLLRPGVSYITPNPGDKVLRISTMTEHKGLDARQLTFGLITHVQYTYSTIHQHLHRGCSTTKALQTMSHPRHFTVKLCNLEDKHNLRSANKSGILRCELRVEGWTEGVD